MCSQSQRIQAASICQTLPGQPDSNIQADSVQLRWSLVKSAAFWTRMKVFFSSRTCKLVASRALADLWLLHHSSRITSARATAQGGCFCMLSKLEMIRSAAKGPTAVEVQEAHLNSLCNKPNLGPSCYLELLYSRWAERQAQTREHSVTSVAHAEV